MKPMIILPPDAMSDEHIQMLRDNDLCVVVSKEPDAIRFLDVPPPPSYDKITEASIELSRIVLDASGTHVDKNWLIQWWARKLLDAHPLRNADVKRVKRAKQNP